MRRPPGGQTTPRRRRRPKGRPVKLYGPLRGRDDALATSLATVHRTRVHGASGVVLITGDPGIGKTPLLSEVCRHAAHMRIRVASSKCDEIEQASPAVCAAFALFQIGLLRSGRDPCSRPRNTRKSMG